MSTKLEEFLYRKSVLITGQTQGIVKDISSRMAGKRVYWLPNGVDLGYYDPDQYNRSWRASHGFSDDEILLAYAGILGYAQGLDVIIKAAALTQGNPDVRYILLGSGPEKERLIKLNEELGNQYVYFLDVITKKEMPHFISAIDACIVPLKKLPLFEGAIPSKIFENLAMKKPVLLGLKGEAKELFVDAGKSGLAFEPEDEYSLHNSIVELLENREKMAQFGENGRKYVEEHFNRNRIAAAFYEVLIELN
jgi:glycosyltransferase involved in cell wall biosynthesis